MTIQNNRTNMGLDLLSEHEMSVVFCDEICKGLLASTHISLEPTLFHFEQWLIAEKVAHRIWTLKIEHEAGGIYLVSLSRRVGEHISHSHDLKRALKMTTVLADRASRNKS